MRVVGAGSYWLVTLLVVLRTERVSDICDILISYRSSAVMVLICTDECVSELMDMFEYHSLLCLLCPDFPLSVVQQAARYIDLYFVQVIKFVM